MFDSFVTPVETIKKEHNFDIDAVSFIYLED